MTADTLASDVRWRELGAFAAGAGLLAVFFAIVPGLELPETAVYAFPGVPVCLVLYAVVGGDYREWLGRGVAVSLALGLGVYLSELL